MKGVLELLRRTTLSGDRSGTPDSMLFSTIFADHGVEPVPWEARANEVGARRLAAPQGIRLLQALWSEDKHMSRLSAEAVQALEGFFDFAVVASDRDLIRQEEYGNFMVVLLSGAIGVNRTEAGGRQVRLTEAHAGDILGEMSLLDSGIRFSMCSTLTECEIAVLGARAMDEMMNTQPQLAAALVTLLARKLSMRLRVLDARLTERPTEN